MATPGARITSQVVIGVTALLEAIRSVVKVYMSIS